MEFERRARNFGLSSRAVRQRKLPASGRLRWGRIKQRTRM